MNESALDIFRRAWEYAASHLPELTGALADHLLLAAVALSISILVCVPLGVFTARAGRRAAAIMGTVNGLRVVPSLAVLFLLVPLLGLSTTAAAVALTVLALPPVLTNTDAAFRSLDPAVIDSARAVGMTRWQRLAQVEFPLALPVILAGIRTAAVEVLSSAALAAFVGSGGLGIYITRGFALFDPAILLVGAVPVALLTLGAEGALAAAQNWARREVVG